MNVTNSVGSDSETKLNYINVITCVYCPAGGLNGTEEWISNVTFNTIDNSSVAGTGYTDYTSISTDVDPGSVHAVSVSCGSTGLWPENYWVFFDWNQDCDFDDPGETYDLGGSNGPDTLSTSVTVPVDAVAGVARMRVFVKYSTDPTSACDDGFSYGEVEEYTVMVAGGDIELELTAMLEGPFDGIGMGTDVNSFLPLSNLSIWLPWNYNGSESVVALPNGNVVEWVMVELRDAIYSGGATGITSIAQQAGFILNDGSIVGLDGTSNLRFEVSISQNLYVVIWQRNHLGILSNNPLSESGGIYSYDFSSGVNQVYGGLNGHKQLTTGTWGMISGDGNQDKIVDINDKSSLWDNDAGSKGYISSDYNLDGESSNTDKNEFWTPNISEESQVPD